MYNSGFKGSIGSAGSLAPRRQTGFRKRGRFCLSQACPKFDAATLPPRADESL